jgi:hypothetical protein
LKTKKQKSLRPFSTLFDIKRKTKKSPSLFDISLTKITKKSPSLFDISFDISTPEYNGGMPGPFKNALDWVSRLSPMPWPNKKILLLGASPGALGAVRGLWHSHVPLEAIGMFVYPEMFGLSQAHLAFDEAGQLKDAATLERLKKLLLKFRDHVGRT